VRVVHWVAHKTSIDGSPQSISVVWQWTCRYFCACLSHHGSLRRVAPMLRRHPRSSVSACGDSDENVTSRKKPTAELVGKEFWRSEGDVCQNLRGTARVSQVVIDPSSAMLGQDGGMDACRVNIGLRHRLRLFDENCKMFECRRAGNLKRAVWLIFDGDDVFAHDSGYDSKRRVRGTVRPMGRILFSIHGSTHG
jgi:hypothetical protein